MTLGSWLTGLADRLVTGSDDRILVGRLSARIGAGGEDGASAFLSLARLIGEAGDASEVIAAQPEILTASAEDAGQAVASLIMHGFAVLRLYLPAQQDAAAARAAIGARAAVAYEAVGAWLGSDALDFLVRFTGETVRQLSALAASRAPLVQVETGISLPASLIAWDLYGNPQRGAEIVERNSSGTAMLMPSRLVALGS